MQMLHIKRVLKEFSVKKEDWSTYKIYLSIYIIKQMSKHYNIGMRIYVIEGHRI